MFRCEIDKRIGVNINTDEGVVVDRYMKKELNLRANVTRGYQNPYNRQ